MPWSRRHPLLAGAQSVLVALGGFLLVAGAQRALIPWPNLYGLADKLESFDEHKDEIDALYLGSSHVLMSVRPTQIDAELAQAGHAWHSFNLGAAGMDGYLLDALLDEVLAAEPARLRWVLLEWNPADPTTIAAGEGEEPTRRDVAWHTPARTLDALRRLDDHPELTPDERWDLQRAHVRAALRRLANLGVGHALIQRLLGTGPERRRLSREALVEQRGHRPRWPDPLDEIARRQELLGDGRAFRQACDRLDLHNAADVTLDDHTLARLERRRALLAEHDVRAIDIITPEMRPRPLAYALAAAGQLDVLLAYNSPARFPRLYDLECRADKVHMSRLGADRFGRLLSADLARLLEQR